MLKTSQTSSDSPDENPDAPDGPARLKLPRHTRMRSQSDFQNGYRGGSRARGRTLRVVVHANGLGYSRYGLSVGKAIWKSAVRRNRVRRIFREAFRLSYPQLPQGFDVILIPAQPKLKPELGETCSELKRLMRKALVPKSQRGTKSRGKGKQVPGDHESSGSPSSGDKTGSTDKTKSGPAASKDKAEPN